MTNCKICKEDCTKDMRLYSHNPIVAEGNCFTCAHWLEVFEDMKEKVSVRLADGKYYSFPKNNPISDIKNRSFLGFGGLTYKIKFMDGSIITTNNLSLNGELPQRWRTQYPRNVKWMKLVKNK